MPENIIIRYRAEGVPELSSAFDTIEKRIAKLTAAASAGAAQRTRATKAEVSEFVASKTVEQKAADNAENEHTKSAEREAKRRASIVDNSAKYAGRLAAQQVKEEAKAEEQATASLEKEARARDRIRDRSAAMAGRYAEQQANAEIAAHRRVGTMIGGAVNRGASRVLGGIASLGGMAVGALGAFSVADAVRGRYKAEESAAQIVNAVTAGGVSPQGANVASIIDKAGGVAVKTGMSKSDIVEGTLAYTRSARGGDFTGAMGNMEFLAKLSKTTGTSISELGGAAGKLQSQNPELDSKGMQQLLLNAYEMSKSGSVSLGDAVSQIGTLASTRGFYQGDVATNQRKLMALGQIAASGGATGDIGTYIKDVSIEVAAKRTHTAKQVGLGSRGVEALGVHFDKYGAMESPEQMIGAIFKATGGDMSKIHGIVGNRGLPLFTELQKSFQTAGGGDAGVAAVQKQIASVANATMSPEQLDAQFAQVMSTSAEKFDVAIEKIRGAIEEKAVPILDALVEKLGDPALMKNMDGVIDAFGALAEFLVANPFSAIGTIVLASITESIAKATIGEAVKQVMVRVAAGESVGGAMRTSGAGGALSVVGGAAMGVVGVASAYLTQHADRFDSEARVKGLLSGAASPAEAAGKIAAIRQALATSKDALADPFVVAASAGLPLNKTINAVGSLFGKQDITGAEAAVARSEEAKAIQRHTAELEKAMAAYTKVLNAGAAGTIASISDPNHPNRSPPIQ
jgi:hypothetical protein